MGLFERKNAPESAIEQVESSAVAAVEQLAQTIRERVDSETGQQIANLLTRLAERVDAMDLAAQMEKAAQRVGEQVEHTGEQLAALGSRSVPEQPSGWITPSLIGFILGLGTGIVLDRFVFGQQEGKSV
ncbi:MAG: hypothetical protein ACUVS4_10645 [Chloroflexaceae bacterium]